MGRAARHRVAIIQGLSRDTGLAISALDRATLVVDGNQFRTQLVPGMSPGRYDSRMRRAGTIGREGLDVVTDPSCAPVLGLVQGRHRCSIVTCATSFSSRAIGSIEGRSADFGDIASNRDVGAAVACDTPGTSCPVDSGSRMIPKHQLFRIGVEIYLLGQIPHLMHRRVMRDHA